MPDALLARLVDDDPRRGVLVFDRSLRYVYANRIAARFNGVDREAHVGRTIEEVNPRVPPVMLDALHKVLADGQPMLDFAVQIADRDGLPQHRRVDVFPAPAGVHPEAALMVVFEDATAEHRALVRLRASEERFRTVFEINLVPLAIWRADGVVHTANKAYLDLVGATEADLAAGRINWFRSRSPLGPALPPDPARALREAHGPLMYEKLLRVGSRDVPVVIGASLLPGRDDEGVSVLIDLSRVRAAEHKLKEASDRFASLAANIPMAVIEQNQQGAIVRWQGEAERMFGYTEAEALGRGLHEVAPWVEEDAPEVRAVRHRLRVERLRATVNENRNRTRSGTLIQCRWYNAALFNAEGEVSAVLSLVQDITAQVEARRALEAAQAEAQRASLAKSDFIAHMSHEIRTPLTAIVGLATSILARTTSDDVHERARSLHATSLVLKQLLDDVLDFARMEVTGVQQQPVPFEPAELVRQVASAFEAIVQERGLVLHLGVDALPDRVVGAPALLRQVLFNLVGNAVKFTDRGSVAILARASADGERLEFEVRDTGRGVSAEVAARIFEPFTQESVSRTRREGGSGLGLAICKRLVDAMGGAIAYRPGMPAGSTFAFTVRVAPWVPAVAPALAGAAPTGGRPGATAARRLRVVLAEDHPLVRRVQREQLESLGHEVVEASGGRAAIELVARVVPDVLVTDLRMPDMDGYAVAAAVRALPGVAGRTPVIALTADQLEVQAQTDRETGIDAWLIKPVDDAALATCIDAVVAREPSVLAS